MTEPLPNLLRSVAAAQRNGRTVAACLIVTARGSTPQPAGALMFLDDTGRLFGTIGGGCLEAEVRRRGMTLLSDRRSELFCFRLDSDYGWDDGLICGGTVELAVAPAPPPDCLEELALAVEQGRAARLELQVQTETVCERVALSIPPRAHLYIAGAGHIGCAVARHAIALDFEVTIFDDRPDLLARAPHSVRTRSGPIARQLAQAGIDQNTYCLIVTRGHRHDQQALAAILERQESPRYIGMIGSRRKVKVTFDDLEARGIPRQRLAAVHAPVGLPIGAQSVEEIAISIAAQLVQVRAASDAPMLTVERCSLPPPDTCQPVGILLAAGKGQRMGCTKQLLPLPSDPQNRALVAAAFDAVARSCGHMVVVVAHDADAVLGALAGRSFTAVHAPHGAEMSESLRAGLRAAATIDQCAPVLLHLADHPCVGQRTLDAIFSASQANPHLAIRPTHGGRGGHPVLIPPAVRDSILESTLEEGLRAWWRFHPATFTDLPVDDPSMLTDVDFPEDYLSLRPRSPDGAARHPVAEGTTASG
jgi:xanthine dehydrogenase accessory factor